MMRWIKQVFCRHSYILSKSNPMVYPVLDVECCKCGKKLCGLNL